MPERSKKMKKITDKNIERELLEIAKKHISETSYGVNLEAIQAALKEAYEKGLNDRQPKERETTVKEYGYEWDTLEKVLENLNTERRFVCYGVTTLSRITDDPKDYRIADELWQRLKRKFNAEAATYKPNAYNSKLGSVGKKEDREVMRSAWWYEIKGDEIGDYDKHTTIIEMLHDGEMLETGRIRFGS